jgi:hypothetical protein
VHVFFREWSIHGEIALCVVFHPREPNGQELLVQHASSNFYGGAEDLVDVKIVSHRFGEFFWDRLAMISGHIVPYIVFIYG